MRTRQGYTVADLTQSYIMERNMVSLRDVLYLILELPHFYNYDIYVLRIPLQYDIYVIALLLHYAIVIL